MKILLIIGSFIMLTSCAELLNQRSYMSEMSNEDVSLFTPNQDFPVIAGDTGQVGRSPSEVQSRTPMTEKQNKRYLSSKSIRQELFDKERKLESEGEELELYNRYKNQLGGTSERIYYLDLTPDDRREYLTQMGLLKVNARYSKGRSIASVAFGDMSLESPINLGMTKHDVGNVWGNPSIVEYAGNPRNQNERWSFLRNGKNNYVYFESGRVVGWELQ